MKEVDIDRVLNAAFAAALKDPRWLDWQQYNWNSIKPEHRK